MDKIDQVRQRNDAIIRACQSVDPDFVVDGEDQDQERWTVCYNYSDGLGWLPVDNFFNLYGTAWVSTEEKAKEVCALLTMWKTEELFRGDDFLINATYYGNTPETCRHIIQSYLDHSGFGTLIEEHPNNYQALEPFKGWWNEYISDGEDEFVEQDKQRLVDAAIEEMKRDEVEHDWTAIEGLLFNVDTKTLKAFLREGQDNG